MEPQEQRKQLYDLLGDLPPRDDPISARRVGEEENATYVCEKLVLDLNDVEPVPAYFIRPRSEAPPWPMTLYNHAHGGDYVLGKDELIRGRNAIQSPPYAEALARKGIASLCIDTWNFGERRGRTESELFKEMLWKGQVLWGMMVYDNIRALDYAVSREDVQEARIGTLGLSMGSTMAWWTAALDVRIKVCVDLCCLTDFHALIESRGLDGHGIYYYVPSLLKHFSTADIAALIAPRPHLSVAGIFDKLTPPTGLDRIDKALKQVYSEWDASDAWRMERYHTGHFETADARAKIFAFLDQWL
jgi:hypothetical protein